MKTVLVILALLFIGFVAYKILKPTKVETHPSTGTGGGAAYPPAGGGGEEELPDPHGGHHPEQHEWHNPYNHDYHDDGDHPDPDGRD